MGDCRIRIQILESLLYTISYNNNNNIVSTNTNKLQSLSVQVWSADTTVYDLFQSIHIPSVSINDQQHGTPSNETIKTTVTLLSLLLQQQNLISIWDCTIYPSRNITDIYCNNHTCHTHTLYIAGWYPSGSIQILPFHAIESIRISSDIYDDYQYNNNHNTYPKKSSNIDHHDNDIQKNENASKQQQVQLMIRKGDNTNDTTISESMILPSQVLLGITQRNDNDHYMKTATLSEQNHMKEKRQQQSQQKLQVQRRKYERLDLRIRQLSNVSSLLKTNSNAVITDQVRTMLIKSRAIGRSSIVPQDRIYVHCILWTDYEDNNNTTTAVTTPTNSNMTTTTRISQLCKLFMVGK